LHGLNFCCSAAIVVAFLNAAADEIARVTIRKYKQTCIVGKQQTNLPAQSVEELLKYGFDF
jgi:hypothetical protein